MFKYLRAALFNRWNLLGLAGGVGAALLGSLGNPAVAAVALPLIAAGEIVLVTFLSTNEKFRKYVEAQEHKVTRQSQTESIEKQVQRIVRALPRDSRDRYDRLRERCIQLQQIADELRQSSSPVGSTLQSFQSQGLDKLLWIFLRLLYTEQSLERFLQNTRVESIEKDIERLENRLKMLEDDTSEHAQKVRHTLEDNLETSRARLANFERARANHEYVELEIDRLENKIKSLAEVAINRQEPDYVSGQVDAVAGSMLETEKTMNELEFVTGLGPVEDQVPSLLFPPVEVIE